MTQRLYRHPSGAVYREALKPEQRQLKRRYLWEQQQPDAAIPTLEEVLEHHHEQEQDDPMDYGGAYNTELDDWSILNWLWDQTDSDPELTAQLDNEDNHPELIDQYREEAEEAYQLELGQQHIHDKIEGLYRYAVEQLAELDGQDCWRKVNLWAGFDPAEQDPLGVYWSREAIGADTYWGHQMRGQGVSVMYRARVDTRYVDKAETILANTVLFMNQGSGEAEVRFLRHAPIYVYDVQLEDGTVIEINDWRRC